MSVLCVLALAERPGCGLCRHTLAGSPSVWPGSVEGNGPRTERFFGRNYVSKMSDELEFGFREYLCAFRCRVAFACL